MARIRLPSPPNVYDKTWANQYTRVIEQQVEDLWNATVVRTVENDYYVFLRATGNAVRDTAALQAVIDAVPDGAIIDLCNTLFSIKTAEPDDVYWYYASQPSRPVFAGIKLTRGNITIRNGRFRQELPDSAYSSGYRPALFCTYVNLQRGTLRNLTFENLSFDFKSTSLIALAAAFYLVGVDGVRLIRNKYYTSGQSHAVTITSVSGDAQINWTAHGYEDPATIRFSGDDLPVEIEADRDYFIRPAVGSDPNAMRISETDDGPMVPLASGTYAATAYAVQLLGRCLTVDNCDNVLDDHCEYDHIRQGWFANCNRDVTFDSPTFNVFAEAMDIDIGLVGASIINPTFTNGYREGQGMDLAGVVDVQIIGVQSDRAAQAFQIYTKARNAEDYTALDRNHYSWPCVFTLGSPGIITSVATATGAPNTPCPILEDERLWIDEPSGLYTFPTGVDKFTTYRAKNVDSVAGTFNIYADTDVTKTAINFTGSVSGTFEFFMIAEVADITTCKNILIDNVTITNGLGIDNDIMLSTERQLRAGVDRAQALRGVGPFVQDLTMTNVNVSQSKRILVNEGQNITLQNINLTDCSPGSDDGSATRPGAALVLLQSRNDTDAIAESILSGTVENVVVTNSQGMGVFIYRPSNFSINRITVDGFNLQEEDNTAYGVRGSQMAGKPGLKTLGEIVVTNGLSGGTVTAVDFWPEVASGVDGFFQLNGPFLLESSGSIKIKGDLGPLVINQSARVIPSQAVGATAIQIPLETERLCGGKFLYASLQNLAAITGSAINYSNLRIRKVDSAGTVSNITSDKAIDDAAVSAATSRDWNVDPTNAATDVLAGEYVYAELTRTGTGSTIPNLLLTYVFVPYV